MKYIQFVFLFLFWCILSFQEVPNFFCHDLSLQECDKTKEMVHCCLCGRRSFRTFERVQRRLIREDLFFSLQLLSFKACCYSIAFSFWRAMVDTLMARTHPAISTELIHTHFSRLENVRRKLQTSWPP